MIKPLYLVYYIIIAPGLFPPGLLSLVQFAAPAMKFPSVADTQRANLKPPDKSCAFLWHLSATCKKSPFPGIARLAGSPAEPEPENISVSVASGKMFFSFLQMNECTSLGLCSPLGSARSILICKAAGHLSSIGKCIVLEHFFPLFFFSSPPLLLNGNAAISDGTAAVPELTETSALHPPLPAT